MGLSIREKADAVATFRFISVYLMETLARWVPTTPELEVKVLFGRHLWDLAQHADAFGKRTAELRLGLHQSRRPTAAFMVVLETMAGAAGTPERLDGFFEVLMPDLGSRCRRYLDETDHLMDEPTVRILERVLADFTRMRRDREQLGQERPDLPTADRAWLERLRRMAASARDYVDFRPPPKTAEVV
ncbi:MAG TPA: hypothetical protein VF970_07600 [Gemmatimonadales bacterium]